MSHSLTLAYLNDCDRQEFIDNLAGIFEHSSWVAEQVADLRPFESVDSLHRAMFTVVQQSPDKAQLKLIREHPELAGKEAETGQLTEESTREQRGAGLDQCTAQELQQLRDLNQAYRQRFGFPFVIAVTGLNRHDILQHLQQRLANEPKQEQQTSIQQIGRIAAIRLQQLIAD